MKSILSSIALLMLCGAVAFTQDKSSEQAKGTPEQLEAKFKAMLSKATMSGRWCSIKEGKLGEDKEDKYNIVSAEKAGGDKWFISARIVVSKKEMVVPIPVQMKWAGDTAIMIVDNLKYPGGGTYSARILFYENTYAGTWSGGDHGGLLNGVITQEKE